MTLPKINYLEYDIVMPSNGQKLKFRPFTAGEEKILLMAMEDSDESQIQTLRRIIAACLILPPNFKYNAEEFVSRMPMFDLDYFWLKLRSKSVEEVVQLPFECHNPRKPEDIVIDDFGVTHDTCETVVYVPVNLEKLEVKKFPENNPKIDIQDGIGVLMRFPTFETVKKLAQYKDKSDIESLFHVISECIECVYEGEKLYEREYISDKEMMAFLESLTQPHFAKIIQFFETMPVLKHEVHFRCPKCKTEVDIVIEGSKSFLASDYATRQ